MTFIMAQVEGKTMYDSTLSKTKFRRVMDRNSETYPESFWKAGYEFEGVLISMYDQVEEYSEDGKLLRIHLLEQLEQIE